VGPKDLLYLSQSRMKYAAPRYNLPYSEWKYQEKKKVKKECHSSGEESILGEFLTYRIKVDWRTFMVARRGYREG
jgi:hypothetical protein